jgi:hypothetical protein
MRNSKKVLEENNLISVCIGTWSVYWLFPIYTAMGGCLGVVELIRRIIPRDIVGHSDVKLKFMDSSVHIFYEVAGTAGAFFSAYFIHVCIVFFLKIVFIVNN